MFNNFLIVCVLWGTARTLHEVSLQESIRYAPGDAVEKWLNDLLCLDCLNITRIVSGCPLPEACELYPSGFYLSRDGERGRGRNYTKGFGVKPLLSGVEKVEHSRFPFFSFPDEFLLRCGAPLLKLRESHISE